MAMRPPPLSKRLVSTRPSPSSPPSPAPEHVNTSPSRSEDNAPAQTSPSRADVSSGPAADRVQAENVSSRLDFAFNGDRVTKAIAEANCSLGRLELQKALQQFTEVLATPGGHPAAFLNRSLCYLLLGYPHLAVTDAHRALICAQHMHYNYPDHINGRASLWFLHLYAQNADHDLDTWILDREAIPGKGAMRFLDDTLSLISIEPKERGQLLNLSQKRKLEEYLIRDLWMKSLYRLAVALWKCGAGAWQSSHDIICRASELPFFTKDDDDQFRPLHNHVMLEIERVIAEENEAREFLRTERHWTWEAVGKHESAGIKALLRSRVTKIKREIYPWDKSSLTWKADLSKSVDLLNTALTRIVPGRVIIKDDGTRHRAPLLSLVARSSHKKLDTIFHERPVPRVVAPRRGILPICCESCGASLDLSKDTLAARAMLWKKQSERMLQAKSFASTSDPRSTTGVATAPENNASTSGSSRPQDHAQRAPTSSPTGDSGKNSEGVPIKDNNSDPSPVESLAEGVQVCPRCCRVAYCSLACGAKALRSGFHHYMCNVNVTSREYPVFQPNVWKIPCSQYSTLLARVLEYAIVSTHREKHPLELLPFKLMHGGLASPRELPPDSSADVIWMWDDDKSIDMDELYPDRHTVDYLRAVFKGWDESEAESLKGQDDGPVDATKGRHGSLKEAARKSGQSGSGIPTSSQHQRTRRSLSSVHFIPPSHYAKRPVRRSGSQAQSPDDQRDIDITPEPSTFNTGSKDRNEAQTPSDPMDIDTPEPSSSSPSSRDRARVLTPSDPMEADNVHTPSDSGKIDAVHTPRDSIETDTSHPASKNRGKAPNPNDSRDSNVSPTPAPSTSPASRATPASSTNFNAPPTPMIDWSYDTCVRQPLDLILDIFLRISNPQFAIRAVLDINVFEGWIYETMRAKLDTSIRIQQFPLRRIRYNEQGVANAKHAFDRPVLPTDEARYGHHMSTTPENGAWMASLFPMASVIRGADGEKGEVRNVELVDRDGALFVMALRDIEVGDELLK